MIPQNIDHGEFDLHYDSSESLQRPPSCNVRSNLELPIIPNAAGGLRRRSFNLEELVNLQRCHLLYIIINYTMYM